MGRASGDGEVARVVGGPSFEPYPFVFSTGARSIFFRHTENRRNPWLIAREPRPLFYINDETPPVWASRKASRWRYSLSLARRLCTRSWNRRSPRILSKPSRAGKVGETSTMPWAGKISQKGSVPCRCEAFAAE
jgi:hypothetical protein